MLVLNIMIAIAVGAVVVILGLGVYSLQRGGEFGRKWSNRLMRYRIAAQAIAVILMLIGILIVRSHQG